MVLSRLQEANKLPKEGLVQVNLYIGPLCAYCIVFELLSMYISLSMILHLAFPKLLSSDLNHMSLFDSHNSQIGYRK